MGFHSCEVIYFPSQSNPNTELSLASGNLKTTSTYLKFKTADLLEMYNRIEL